MRPANIFVLFLSVLTFFSSIPTSVRANTGDDRLKTPPEALRLDVGQSDVPSRMAAIGLNSLARLQRPGFEIDTTWIHADDDALERLEADEADLALLELNAIDPAALDDRSLRAVMKYWLSDEALTDGQETTWQGYLLIARASLPADRVDAILDVALQDHPVLKASRIDVARLTPDKALTALPITRHDAVETYLRHHGDDLPPAAEDMSEPGVAAVAEDAMTPIAPPPAMTETDIARVAPDVGDDGKPDRSFTLYFDTADASVDESGFRSVAAACEFAASLAEARFVISGHADTVGSEAYNRDLSNQRARAVADAIRNDPRFREALSVVEFGEQRPAVATGDGVNEPKNRRVEITVFEE